MRIKFLKEDWEEFLSNIDFTDKELEIIPLMRRGWAQIDIAAELDISLSTTKRRMTAITNKVVCYIMRTREPKIKLI